MYRAWGRFSQSKLAVIGMVLIFLILLMAAFAPKIARVSPLSQKFKSFSAPSARHPFGTDELGRDLFSRVIYGSQASLSNGILAILFSIIIGLIAGSLAGYYGGLVDTVIMRVVDIFLAFPYILGAIVLMVILQPGPLNIPIAIAAFYWASFARLYRASVLEVKEKEYVKAAKAMGASNLRIIARHITPNAASPLVVYAAMGIGSAILAEAVLSFIGLGTQPPTPSWGLILSDAMNYIGRAPWMMWFPGLFLIISVLGFVLVSDGLRNVLDPHLNRR